jgi:hypothetical protein
MEKLRFVVMAAVTVAAAGVLALGYRLGAAEPPAPARGTPPAVPAAAVPPVGQPGVHKVRGINFEVEAPTHRAAALILEAAERQRKEKAVLWLGKELPAWPQRCPIQARITMTGSGGATTFEYVDGAVKSRRMHLEGPLDRLLSSVLPHEITHTIFADYLGEPMVRWADEGGAVLSEDDEEQQRYENLFRQVVDTPGRAIALRRLLSAREYPADMTAFMTQSYSLARFLVQKKDHRAFLAFVKRGMRDGWDKAVKEHYEFRDVEALEDAWLVDLRRRTAAPPIPAAPRGRQFGGLTLPPQPPPVTGLAVIDEQGRLHLCEVASVLVPVQEPVQTDAKGGAQFVTRYAAVTQISESLLDPAVTPVYGTDGKRIDAKKLPELLRKEIPVLVAKDGKMVDPFHLRLIKEGSLIVVPPVTPPALLPRPPEVAPEPPLSEPVGLSR